MGKKIDHKNIVKFHGIYQDDDLYIVTEYAGQNLKCYLNSQISKFIQPANRNVRESTELLIKDLIDIALDIASAMIYLSDNHIVHRDLKIDNVVILKLDGAKRFLAVLIDFGLSIDLTSEKGHTHQDTTMPRA